MTGGPGLAAVAELVRQLDRALIDAASDIRHRLKTSGYDLAVTAEHPLLATTFTAAPDIATTYDRCFPEENR